MVGVFHVNSSEFDAFEVHVKASGGSAAFVSKWIDSLMLPAAIFLLPENIFFAFHYVIQENQKSILKTKV